MQRLSLHCSRKHWQAVAPPESARTGTGACRPLTSISGQHPPSPDDSLCAKGFSRRASPAPHQSGTATLIGNGSALSSAGPEPVRVTVPDTHLLFCLRRCGLQDAVQWQQEKTWQQVPGRSSREKRLLTLRCRLEFFQPVANAKACGCGARRELLERGQKLAHEHLRRNQQVSPSEVPFVVVETG
jgi:hypothetical protein